MIFILGENKILQTYRPRPLIESTRSLRKAAPVDNERRPSSSPETIFKYAPEVPLKSDATKAKHLAAYENQSDEMRANHPLTVAAIMSQPPVTVSEEAEVGEALRIMHESKIRHLPVLSHDGLLAGIIADQDLRAPAKGKVADLMIKAVISVGGSASLKEVSAVMINEKLSCLPVIDSQRNVLGVVTRTDILKALLVRSSLEIWTYS